MGTRNRQFVGWAAFWAAFALALGTLLSVAFSRRIAPGVTVSGIPVGGLAVDQARSVLETWSDRLNSRPIRLIAADKTWHVQPKQIGLDLGVHQALREAYSIGRTGPLLSRWAMRVLPVGDRSVRVRCRIDETAASKLLGGVARATNLPHADAKLLIEGGRISMQRERVGRKLKAGEALAMLRAGAFFDTGSLKLPIELDTPEVTAADLHGIDTQLASFSTHFPNRRGDRAHNIRLASAALDGALLKPGATFSYNKRVGPRLPRLGFKIAPIYVNGEIERGPGGGVCQISTTTYNAALLAGLDIVARSNHSMPVHYVPAGRDATVAYGGPDLKFRNNFAHPVYLSAKVNRNTVTASIYGFGADRRKVRVYTSKRRTIPMGYQIVAVADPSTSDGKRTVRLPKPPGFGVTVYRRIEYAGKTFDEVVSRDRYRPMSKKESVSPTVGPSATVTPASDMSGQ